MRLLKVFIISFFYFTSFSAISQTKEMDSIRIVFYNVENFFDTRHDSLKGDKDFTPKGKYHWTYNRFEQKRNNIYKTLIAAGEWSPPAIVGFCEIENDYVLNELCKNTPLRKFNYKYVHFESPDPRGIDVALIYRPDKFNFLTAYPIPVKYKSGGKTRDILYVKGVVFGTDTIHLYVNHFPSRLGGKKSIEKRNYVAGLLRMSTNSILETNPNANIIIMGDFNDDPFNVSLKDSLRAAVNKNEISKRKLINLMASKAEKEGSYKYQAAWSLIDQFIVSKALYENNRLYVRNQMGYIFGADFLLIDDEKNLDKKPFRTFSGPKYLGGFSDHLPIYFDLKKCKY